MDNQSNSGASLRGSAEWWRVALTRLNNVLLQAPWLEDFRDGDLAEEDVERGWLGRPGASESDLAELEGRLGIQLCPSYRALLEVCDGFGKFGEFAGRLLPSSEVNWFTQRNPDVGRMIEAYMQAGHPLKPPAGHDPQWSEDIPLRSIEIAENVESCALILHPSRADAAAEWEVWPLIGTYQRYATLADYMDATISQLETPPSSAFGPIVF
jgi:hypothetical protein